MLLERVERRVSGHHGLMHAPPLSTHRLSPLDCPATVCLSVLPVPIRPGRQRQRLDLHAWRPHQRLLCLHDRGGGADSLRWGFTGACHLDSGLVAWGRVQKAPRCPPALCLPRFPAAAAPQQRVPPPHPRGRRRRCCCRLLGRQQHLLRRHGRPGGPLLLAEPAVPGCHRRRQRRQLHQLQRRQRRGRRWGWPHVQGSCECSVALFAFERGERSCDHCADVTLTPYRPPTHTHPPPHFFGFSGEVTVTSPANSKNCVCVGATQVRALRASLCGGSAKPTRCTVEYSRADCVHGGGGASLLSAVQTAGEGMDATSVRYSVWDVNATVGIYATSFRQASWCCVRLGAACGLSEGLAGHTLPLRPPSLTRCVLCCRCVCRVMQASFGGDAGALSAIYGLVVATPLDGCGSLQNDPSSVQGAVVLIQRGGSPDKCGGRR